MYDGIEQMPAWHTHEFSMFPVGDGYSFDVTEFDYRDVRDAIELGLADDDHVPIDHETGRCSKEATGHARGRPRGCT